MTLLGCDLSPAKLLNVNYCCYGPASFPDAERHVPGKGLCLCPTCDQESMTQFAGRTVLLGETVCNADSNMPNRSAEQMAVPSTLKSFYAAQACCGFTAHAGHQYDVDMCTPVLFFEQHLNIVLFLCGGTGREHWQPFG